MQEWFYIPLIITQVGNACSASTNEVKYGITRFNVLNGLLKVIPSNPWVTLLHLPQTSD